MSKYAINDTTLTAIADSIRAKGGTSDPIQVSNFASAIANLPTGGGLPPEALVFTGALDDYTLSGQVGEVLIDYCSSQLNFSNITSAKSLFAFVDRDLSDFTININNCYPDGMFYDGAMSALPKIVGSFRNSGGLLQGMFYNCHNLREIPTSVFEQATFPTGDYISLYNLLAYNYSLKSIPSDLIKRIAGSADMARTYYGYSVFRSCFALSEILNFPVAQRTLTSNAFSDFVDSCGRLKSLTFDTDNGVVKTGNWKNQIIDLTDYVGYNSSKTQILNYNSGITADKEVNSVETYQALKNDPDWFTTNAAYSRYNHDSAVATINSLPDTSAYLATAGGTNTIKFNGEAGSATDGGAINTLTEEEIAVATAKGWTVSLV